jgi:hypothetical protein
LRNLLFNINKVKHKLKYVFIYSLINWIQDLKYFHLFVILLNSSKFIDQKAFNKWKDKYLIKTKRTVETEITRVPTDQPFNKKKKVNRKYLLFSVNF